MKLLLKWEKELVRKNKRDIKRVCTIKMQHPDIPIAITTARTEYGGPGICLVLRVKGPGK